MNKSYMSGWVTISGNRAKAVRTIPLDADYWGFDAEMTQERLGSEVRLTLTGIKLKPLIGSNGIDTGVIVVDLGAVKEFVDGHPVLDTWVIYSGKGGSEVGVQIDVPNGRTIRIFSSADDRYIVQEVRGDFVKEEVNDVSCFFLGEIVLGLAGVEKIDLGTFQL